MKNLVLSCLIAAGLLAAASAHAATMVIDPVTAGAGVTVTGSGAKPNGPVELYQNGNSLGSVLADGTGAFSFPGLTVAGGDTFHATASQVWNFNTPGNTEGWVAIGATDVVAGGVWTLTHTSGGNITMNLAGPAVIPDTDLSRVFEMRYRTAAGLTTSAVIYDPGTGFQFGPQNVIGSSPTNFTTMHVDMTNGGNNYTSTGVSNQLAPGANGFNPGDVWEIDYIRMHEYFAWEFNNANDDHFWRVPNGTGTATATGSSLSMVNSAANTAVRVSQPFYQISADYFTVFETSIDANPAINPNLFFFNYFTNGFAFTGGGHQPGWAPSPGNFVNVTIDLTTPPAFGPGWLPIAALNFPAGGVEPMFPLNANETANVDYLRLRTATPYGPAPTVTATGGATTNDGVNIY